jgi:hypothetical protein
VKHRERHPEYQEGCNPCKWRSISFGTVPGGARDQRTGIGNANQRERDLHRYREKRRAGEQPDGTTREAMDRSERREEVWLRQEQSVVDSNPPEAAKKIKKALTNLA